MRPLILSLFLLLPFWINSQTDLTPERFAFEPELTYDASIETPQAHLGYELGASFTLYAHAVAYFQYLASVSDRVQIHQYGETYEGRKLYNLIISSPENIQNIETLREQNHLLAHPDKISNSEAKKIIDEKPVFVSYSYNIHGNEASSTEAAMQVSYRLAAAKDAATVKDLEEAVMIFYICINPDGRDRYVYWYEGMKKNLPGIEPSDLEHFAPWPNGRTNHYWFDLNRDWIWGIHPESRGHTAEYVKWMPQIHTDYHEQGYNSNYFTVPGTTPRNKLLPDDYESLADTIGRANIEAFDYHKINYFTREAFDFFYPGYGSSYPTVMNAIGMLTEQGGIAAGRAITTNDQNILTLRQRIFDHYTTSIATIKKAVERKELFNSYTYETSKPSSSKTSTASYLLPNDGSNYIDDVVNVLLNHGVSVHQSTSKVNVERAYDYRRQKMTNTSLPQGSYIIHTDQPRHLFINTLLAPKMAIEDSVMYDMSTWSAPLAYNLEAFSTNSRVNVPSVEVLKAVESAGTVINPTANYAFVIDWNQRHAPKALSKLWEKGYRVRSAQEAFSDGSTSFAPGTLILIRGRNLERDHLIEEDMRSIAQSCAIKITGLNSGRMEVGNDLASRKSKVLSPPKVALLVEPPFNTYTCGQLYFLFDQETELPIERIRTSMLNQTAIPKLGSRYGYVDLRDYDVLILPGGGNNLKKIFKEDQQLQIKEWVRSGGTIVATESATDFFTKEHSNISEMQISKVPKDSSEHAKYLTFEERESYRGKKRIPGTALNGHIDVSHPLGFGVKDQLYTLTFRNTGILPHPNLEAVGYYHKDSKELLSSGYASADNLELLAGQVFAGVHRIGQGKIIYLTDNTQYRMFWRGPSRMMQNAVMLLPSF